MAEQKLTKAGRIDIRIPGMAPELPSLIDHVMREHDPKAALFGFDGLDMDVASFGQLQYVPTLGTVYELLAKALNRAGSVSDLIAHQSEEYDLDLNEVFRRNYIARTLRCREVCNWLGFDNDLETAKILGLAGKGAEPISIAEIRKHYLGIAFVK